MRLSQIVEAAHFAELPPPEKMYGTFEKMMDLIRHAIDENTGVGWILDPQLRWKQKFKQLVIDKRILEEIRKVIVYAGSDAAENDSYDDQVFYHELQRIYEKQGKLTYEPVRSPTTGRDGWKFVLKPPMAAAKRVALQAVHKFMQEQARKR